MNWSIPIRTLVLAILPVFAGFIARTASAGELPATRMQDFLVPHQKVEVAAGRSLNLFCLGSGKATVMFEAGGSDWSVVWSLVQPMVARDARACSYDRAGLGYSDPAGGARSPVELVEDLHTLIHKADLQGPLGLVGQSLGGVQVKLYAALYPREVAGLVLVEPSEERAWERTRKKIRARSGRADASRAELLDRAFLFGLMDHYRHCRDAAREKDLDPASDTYRHCADPPRKVLGDAVAAERQRLQVTGTYQAAQAAEIEHSIYGDLSGDDLYAELFRPGVFGSLPLVLLARPARSPDDILDAIDVFQTTELQAPPTALSRKGTHKNVDDVSHHIELDAPGIVANAILEIVASAAGRGTPPP